MTPSLASLPPELFSCVLDNITSLSTLSKLTRCSRQFQLCTNRHLYRDVVVLETTRTGWEQKPHLRNLASLLMRRPDLAVLVRSFSFRLSWHRWTVADWEDLSYEIEDFQRMLPPYLEKLEQDRDEALLSTLGNASSLSTEEKLMRLELYSHDHPSHHDYILALLLPTLLKVEAVVLDMESSWTLDYFEAMLRRAAYRERPFDVQPPFKALREFFLSNHYLFIRSPVLTSSLLKLPAMQRIQGGFETSWHKQKPYSMIRKAIWDLPVDKKLIELDSSSSTLTSLSLAPYRLGPTELSDILRVPKALKALSFKFCLPYITDFTTIRQALEPQENSLEILCFDTILPCDRPIISLSGLTSFISFNNLKVFKSAASFLTDPSDETQKLRLIDIFPPSLETLHVTQLQASFSGLLEALEHLVSQKSSQQIPSLIRLVLEEKEKDSTWFDQLMNTLWKDSEESSIDRLRRVGAAKEVSADVVEHWLDMRYPSPEPTEYGSEDEVGLTQVYAHSSHRRRRKRYYVY